MLDYKNGKIYKLWCYETDEIYIGSTCDTLSRRLAKHKASYNSSDRKCSSKILFEKSNNVIIELIESYPCENKMELNKKEGEYIRKLDCINKVIAGRTNKEWKEDNKVEISEKKKEHNKKYYENNKKEIAEKMKFKIMCNLCKCKINKHDFSKHTKTLKHYGALTAATAATGLDDGITAVTSLEFTEIG